MKNKYIKINKKISIFFILIISQKSLLFSMYNPIQITIKQIDENIKIKNDKISNIKIDNLNKSKLKKQTKKEIDERQQRLDFELKNLQEQETLRKENIKKELLANIEKQKREIEAQKNLLIDQENQKLINEQTRTNQIVAQSLEMYKEEMSNLNILIAQAKEINDLLNKEAQNPELIKIALRHENEYLSNELKFLVTSLNTIIRYLGSHEWQLRINYLNKLYGDI